MSQLSLFETISVRPLQALGVNRVEPISALSVKQPWAYAILELGKDVENRSWWTPYRGDLLIHAPKSADYGPAWDAIADVLDPDIRRSWDRLPVDPRGQIRGALIGVVELVQVVQGYPSPWAEHEGGRIGGPWNWVLARPRWLPEPIPARGYQSLWQPTTEDVIAIRRQLGEAGWA